ncbi:hypothetical protein ABEB36_005485 [Hypothenemus hampei]|uniref:EGF-like domain-containing protein n=1 Tax=Hypothenemus hampei TaxID=57062 RepID=A0ABD1EYR7_HYPHA
MLKMRETVVLFIMITTYALCYAETNMSSSVHAGAARQMLGSSSLRQQGKKPILATGQRHYGVRTTLKPDLARTLPGYKYIPPQYYDYFKNFHWAVALSEQPINIDGPRSSGTKRIIHGGSESVPNTRKKISRGDSAYGPIQPLIPCYIQCENGTFLCEIDCMCILEEYRCDGHAHCSDNKDEEQCENFRNRTTVICEEIKNFVMCPKTKKCISRDWLCDGDDDCGDYSDETHCGNCFFSLKTEQNFELLFMFLGSVQNCSTDQFQCENGLCIPKSWTCDNDNDCRDFSDEVNCTETSCAADEFKCLDGTCITVLWKCDHNLDCVDGSDERDCDIMPAYCNEKEFQCENHECIKFEFRCDGDDDCEDWSDENNCPMNIGECVSGEFKCENGFCIPKRWLCDFEKDCSHEEDEKNCDYSVNKTCNSDEFTCTGGQCILKSWVCDGMEDCPNGEDEQKCNILCDDAKFPCTGSGANDNNTIFCINRKHICDGQSDCPKGDDEQNCPSKRDCEDNTKCEQLCVTYPGGRQGCSCYNGYKLDQNGYTCNDIDECMLSTDPVCSQKCNNTPGTFKCSCMTGYILRPDLRTCKAVGAPPTLLFANRIDIRQMSLSNSKYSLTVKGLHNVISLDYHYDKQLIFWSDISIDKIKRAGVNGTGVTTIISSGLDSPGGIAIDWVHDLLYWTDSGTKRIEVATLDGTHRAVIIANELDKPRAIVVHPGQALIFWTDWGPNSKIERAEMDGSDRRSIISESVFWPNGLALDYTANQIYWADAKHNVIESSGLDGSKRKKIVTKGLPHPFALTIFEDAIFWTDWHTKSITTANKITGAGLKILHSQLYFPMDIHTYHPQRQPKFNNRCGNNNGGCQHLCLPNRRSYTCVCRMGQKLKPDKKTCLKPDKFMIFAKKKDIRIKHLDGSIERQNEMVIPLEGIKDAVAIAWDSKMNYIFWTDLGMKSINRAFWNGSNHQVIFSTNILEPKGLSYDWVTDKLYWSDFGSSRIEVATTDGSIRSLLIWENLDKPGDITVDPPSGLMFWAQLGANVQIEKANMDGSNRIVLVSSNISTPRGLTVDPQSARLFWADGNLRTISSISFDGTGREILLSETTLSYPYGLDIFEDNIFWSDWLNKSIEKANKITGGNRTVVVRNVPDSMDVKIFHRTRKNIRNPCANRNNGGCSHLCLLKARGHSCACPTGIKLMDDKKTCTNGPLNYLILAHRMYIRQISLDVPYMADVVLPLKHLKIATSVDVDRKTGQIYWTDTLEDCIQRANPNGTNREMVVSQEIEAPEGIAIDSTGRKIYWTDRHRQSIEVSEMDGTNRKVLINDQIYHPRAITLHYHHGLMFWTDWDEHNPKIEVAHMDGTHRTALISENITWPNGLAIDRPAQRLYWTDSKRNTIESCDLDGKNRRLIMNKVPYPYALVIVGNHVYWTDWHTQALHRAEKETGAEQTKIQRDLEGLMDVRSVQYDNIAENACGENNGGCSHLCLRNPSGYTCACPTGLARSKTHPNHCDKIPQTFLLTAARYSLSQISLDTNDTWDVTLPIKDDMQNAVDVDFHYKKKLIFYSDIGRNVIKSVNMYNWSDVRLVVGDNLSSPEGIAVDWLSNNIYWTNTGHKKIEVARLDGSYRKTILSKLGDPKSLVCNPKAGYLYWSDWDRPSHKIERSYLDGSNRQAIITKELSFPIGLAIDFPLRRLYWIYSKLDEERIQSSDYNGHHITILPMDKTHPFSLTTHRESLYWTDWDKKTIMRANKISGENKMDIRPMYAAVGITMVTEERQPYWNPCALDNGNCTHLCFFKKKGYTCACPDKPTSTCKTSPRGRVSNVCPEGKGFDCVDYIDVEDDYPDPHFINTAPPEEPPAVTSNSAFYVITLVPMSALIIMSIGVVVYILVKRGKKNYAYGASRSFSNPNYYSNDPSGTQNPAERKQFLWRRLKYDKSQERVYEETVMASPEVTSLIPTILTPCNSNCEVVTPELERSPSVTPLHKVDVQ